MYSVCKGIPSQNLLEMFVYNINQQIYKKVLKKFQPFLSSNYSIPQFKRKIYPKTKKKYFVGMFIIWGGLCFKMFCTKKTKILTSKHQANQIPTIRDLALPDRLNRPPRTGPNDDGSHPDLANAPI